MPDNFLVLHVNHDEWWVIKRDDKGPDYHKYVKLDSGYGASVLAKALNDRENRA